MLTVEQHEQLANLDIKIPLKTLLNITSITLADTIDSKDLEVVKILFELYCRFSEDLKELI
jgi:hypothetical protein